MLKRLLLATWVASAGDAQNDRFDDLDAVTLFNYDAPGNPPPGVELWRLLKEADAKEALHWPCFEHIRDLRDQPEAVPVQLGGDDEEGRKEVTMAPRCIDADKVVNFVYQNASPGHLKRALEESRKKLRADEGALTVTLKGQPITPPPPPPPLPVGGSYPSNRKRPVVSKKTLAPEAQKGFNVTRKALEDARMGLKPAGGRGVRRPSGPPSGENSLGQFKLRRVENTLSGSQPNLRQSGASKDDGLPNVKNLVNFWEKAPSANPRDVSAAGSGRSTKGFFVR